MKKLLLIVSVWLGGMIYVFSQEEPPQEPPYEPPFCTSLYFKEETLVQPDREEFRQQCENFCTINSCQLKYASIGAISGGSNNFYKACICQ